MPHRHVRVHSEPGHTPTVDVDGLDPAMILGMTVDLEPGRPPFVRVDIRPDALDLDLHGVLDVSLDSALRALLHRIEADRDAAVELEGAALDARSSGLGGQRGDTAVGFLRALCNMLDAADD